MARGAEDLGPMDIAISDATGDAVHAAGKEVFVAHMLGRSQPTINRWGDRNVAEFIPLRLVPQLEMLGAGSPAHPHITRALARMQGFELYQRPEADGEPGDWLAQIGLLSAEAADITGAICRALEDGKICTRDVRQLNMVDDARQLVGVVLTLLARVEALAAE
ncbi:MAG: hypothetical protein U9R64_15100 [Pseudomonadota bacterium]|nr:hypothetical protein [Pseudomonadota bacterium]